MITQTAIVKTRQNASLTGKVVFNDFIAVFNQVPEKKLQIKQGFFPKANLHTEVKRIASWNGRIFEGFHYVDCQFRRSFQ